MLAKAAKEFGVPVILTAVETESFSGYLWPQLMDVFPGQQPIERTSMNSWDDPGIREAVKATGKKNIILAGLWTEVCITWPTLNMLAAGYNIYIVEDACGATSQLAHDAAMRRCVQAGAVPMTTIATVLEFQRDWANREHYDALMEIFREHAGAYGSGIEYAYSMVHKAPQSAKNPHVVKK
jgi:nicotinamidase-related amidase